MVRKSNGKLLRDDFGDSIYESFEMNDRSNKVTTLLEFMIYFVGFLGTLLALQQAYQIWFNGVVIGSLISWIALAVFTPFWIFYGAMNKKFSLAMTYVVWFVSTLLVIIGIYVKGQI
ncbi:MAG: hypothetical protein KKD18_03940 [Nanoarchaeota archaeon]|nr:hypothetical protein [Nanoarchaeota archaeon]MBU0977543.1 hypothetical protein [Nanoarchaeota archaeon]